jgi:mono/diheme cytochrome c family protein
MMRRCVPILILVVTMLGAAVAARSEAQPRPAGWVLPADADETKNPLTVDARLLATGKSIFTQKCQRCHGPGGVGDGADADPDAREDMDLTNARRADRNSEGVMFYKVWNGRRKPKMPAFKDELTKDQAWAVVAYAQSLRRTP